MRPRLLAIAFPLAIVVVIAATMGISLALMGPDDRADAPRAGSLSGFAPRGPAPAPQPAAPAAASAPRQVFAHTCGMCHSLRAAGASGRFGPDLDDARPSARRVRRMIRTGSIDGVMQPGLLHGRQATRVAAYVARVAGRR
jgi:mono/diheme cytochrome c family protein